jgi:hypothetical protein
MRLCMCGHLPLGTPSCFTKHPGFPKLRPLLFIRTQSTVRPRNSCLWEGGARSHDNPHLGPFDWYNTGIKPRKRVLIKGTDGSLLGPMNLCLKQWATGPAFEPLAWPCFSNQLGESLPRPRGGYYRCHILGEGSLSLISDVQEDSSCQG